MAVLPPSLIRPPVIGCLTVFIALLFPATAQADKPIGWISGDFTSAYTQDSRSVEITTQAIAVNDTIDFLDIREDLLAGNRRLLDDSGDLSGWQGTLRVGIFDTLSLFYQRQQHDIVIKVGAINSLNVLDIDKELKTTSQELGFKWTIYQADLSAPNREITQASLELSRIENSSQDYDLAFDSVTLRSGNTTANLTFSSPQTAGMGKLEDSGWRARFIYTKSLAQDTVSSLWLGYGSASASSGTVTSVTFPAIRDALVQQFDVDEDQVNIGASINWQFRPRLPVQLSYEYVSLHNQEVRFTVPGSTTDFDLPSFLSGNNLSSDTSNHILTGSVSWWLTPELNLGVTGKIFTNQFIGKIPHYNNPLSGGFSDNPYGYIGVRLGLDL